MRFSHLGYSHNSVLRKSYNNVELMPGSIEIGELVPGSECSRTRIRDSGADKAAETDVLSSKAWRGFRGVKGLNRWKLALNRVWPSLDVYVRLESNHAKVE